MSRNAKKRWMILASLAGLLAQPLGVLADSDVREDLEIFQLQSTIKEGNEAQWVVRLDQRPRKTGFEGYRPTSEAASTWEPEVDFRWNFGDDTGWISTGPRPSITHRYMKLGVYSLRVEARSPGGTISDVLPVSVVDRDYYSPSINAIEIDPARSLYELTAGISNPSQDELTVAWNFLQRGLAAPFPAQEGTDLWRIQRQFPPGLHEVQVTWEGDDGTRATKTIELKAGPDFSDLEDLTERVAEQGLGTRFEGSFHGGLPNARLVGEVRPFAGIFLGSTGSGQCRFMMTAWDPKQLVMVQLIANVPGLPKNGISYQYSGSIAQLAAKPNATEYLEASSLSGFNERVSALVGRRRAQGDLDEDVSDSEINTELRRQGAEFVQVGDRESQLENSTPVEISPLVGDKEEGYRGVEGTVQIKFLPPERVVGILDVVMEGGATYDSLSCTKGRPYKGGMCKELTLKAEFVLDLETAPRDGVVIYQGCAPKAEFAIDSIYGPQHEELHHHDRHARVAVSFDSKLDPETLDDTTLQLGYRDRSGRFVEVESRIHRDDDSAYIVPVEELWGGVRYKARIKIGEEGVRGLNSGYLKSEDLEEDRLESDDWYVLRDFWTRLDFASKVGKKRNLACHLWQGARDAPLIAGKPAVAQVLASWEENSRVHPDDQWKALPAKVQLKKKVDTGWVVIAETGLPENGGGHTFPRPDLAPPPTPEARSTARLGFLPDREHPDLLSVSLVVDRNTPADKWWPYYSTLCSAPLWKHEPKLIVELVPVLAPWTDEQIPASDLQDLAGQLTIDVRSRFPLRDVEVRVGDPVDAHHGSQFLETDFGPGFFLQLADTLEWKRRIDRQLAERADPGEVDVVVGIFEKRLPKFWIPRRAQSIAAAYPSVLEVIHTDTEVAVGNTLHQLGHVFGLEDVPHTQSDPDNDFDISRFDSVESLYAAMDAGAAGHFSSNPLEWHDGFAHALISESSVQFYSSEIGGFDQHPLMNPSSSDLSERLLLRHHYLKAMRVIERSVLSRGVAVE